jgi:hypothetical protein
MAAARLNIPAIIVVRGYQVDECGGRFVDIDDVYEEAGAIAAGLRPLAQLTATPAAVAGALPRHLRPCQVIKLHGTADQRCVNRRLSDRSPPTVWPLAHRGEIRMTQIYVVCYIRSRAFSI